MSKTTTHLTEEAASICFMRMATENLPWISFHPHLGDPTVRILSKSCEHITFVCWPNDKIYYHGQWELHDGIRLTDSRNGVLAEYHRTPHEITNIMYHIDSMYGERIITSTTCLKSMNGHNMMLAYFGIDDTPYIAMSSQGKTKSLPTCELTTRILTATE